MSSLPVNFCSIILIGRGSTAELWGLTTKRWNFSRRRILRRLTTISTSLTFWNSFWSVTIGCGQRLTRSSRGLSISMLSCATILALPHPMLEVILTTMALCRSKLFAKTPSFKNASDRLQSSQIKNSNRFPLKRAPRRSWAASSRACSFALPTTSMTTSETWSN